jgi:hypothetical protein
MKTTGNRSVLALSLVLALVVPTGAETYRLATWNTLHFNYTSYPTPGDDQNRVDGFMHRVIRVDAPLQGSRAGLSPGCR